MPRGGVVCEGPRVNTGERNEVLLIAGRSGVGKSTVAWEVSAVLRAAGAAHCLV